MVDISPFWLTVRLGFPNGSREVGSAFWTTLTGYELDSDPGVGDGALSWRPRIGDAYLELGRTTAPGPRLTMVLHTADPQGLGARVAELGAITDPDQPEGTPRFSSPAGIGFELAAKPAGFTPTPHLWAGGHSSRLRQICWDVPKADFFSEARFWRELLGGEWSDSDGHPPLTREGRDLALAVRLQQAEFATEVFGHLHVSTDGRTSEVSRLVDAGAVIRSNRERQTMLETPGGLLVCVIDQQRDGMVCQL